MFNIEDKNNTIPIVLGILALFITFGVFATFKMLDIKARYMDEENTRIALLEAKEQERLLEEQMQKDVEATPTPEVNLLTKDQNLNIDSITNYDIGNLGISINGVNCYLPFSVSSMVSYGYLFRDKIASDGYTYNQLSETLSSGSYSSFIDTLSPNSQIISVLIKNPYETDQTLLNCDVYGISASTSYYSGNEVEPSMVLTNGLYLGMTEGDMLKIMGSYDKKFYPEKNNKNIARYQWYQSTDGMNINNILTCDVVNGYVQMLSIEIE